MITLTRWTLAALGNMFLGIQPKRPCTVCGEPHRDMDAHVWVEHGGDVGCRWSA